jgi:hypothetical protein
MVAKRGYWHVTEAAFIEDIKAQISRAQAQVSVGIYVVEERWNFFERKELGMQVARGFQAVRKIKIRICTVPQ